MKHVLISSIFLASISTAQATPVTVKLYENDHSPISFFLDDFDIPGVVDFTSNMGFISEPLSDYHFTGIQFSSKGSFLRLDFAQSVFSFSIDTIRTSDLWYNDGIREVGNMYGIGYKDNGNQQLLSGILERENKSFTFLSDSASGFKSIIFEPISPIYAFKIPPELFDLYYVAHIGWGIEAVSFDTATAIPEPETYALMLTGLGVLGLTRRRENKIKS